MYVNYEQQEGIVEVEKEDSDEFSQGFEFIQVTDAINGDHQQSQFRLIGVLVISGIWVEHIFYEIEVKSKIRPRTEILRTKQETLNLPKIFDNRCQAKTVKEKLEEQE